MPSRVVEGGRHFLSASNPEDVNPATAEFIDRWKERERRGPRLTHAADKSGRETGFVIAGQPDL